MQEHHVVIRFGFVGLLAILILTLEVLPVSTKEMVTETTIGTWRSEYGSITFRVVEKHSNKEANISVSDKYVIEFVFFNYLDKSDLNNLTILIDETIQELQSSSTKERSIETKIGTWIPKWKSNRITFSIREWSTGTGASLFVSDQYVIQTILLYVNKADLEKIKTLTNETIREL